MAGLITSNRALQSFTFVKENGQHSLRSNMPNKPEFYLHEDEVYQKRNVEKMILESEFADSGLAEYIYQWQQTEKGQWVMKHGLTPTFTVMQDYLTFTHIVLVTAHIKPKRWTEFCLKFS